MVLGEMESWGHFNATIDADVNIVIRTNHQLSIDTAVAVLTLVFGGRRHVVVDGGAFLRRVSRDGQVGLRIVASLHHRDGGVAMGGCR